MLVNDLRHELRNIETKVYVKEKAFLLTFAPSDAIALEGVTFTSDLCLFTVLMRSGKVEQNQTTLELAFKWVERN
jgi:hypothetical protein